MMFSCNEGNYNFDQVVIANGELEWAESEMVYMVNSVIFEILNANLTVNNSQINDIHTLFSSPVLYI